jgi:hypothetical protein
VATLVLIFFVADATWLCWRLTRDIRTPTTIWPERTLQEFSGRYGLPQQVLGDCIDLIFVAKRSKCITNLLYGPFLHRDDVWNASPIVGQHRTVGDDDQGDDQVRADSR